MHSRNFRFLFLMLCFTALLSVFAHKAHAGYITPAEPDFTSNRNGTVPSVWQEVPGNTYAWTKQAQPTGKDACFTCHPFKQDEPGLTRAEWDMDVHVKVKGTFQCEACHGPGSMHQDANAPKYVVNPTDLPKPQQNEMCQACHLQGMAFFHGSNNVSCLDCHQFHTVKNPKDLKKLPVRELCYSCHAQVKLEFSMFTHHPVNEGVMTCTDCHTPHFSSSTTMLKNSFAILGSRPSIEACGTCHPQEAGPNVSSPTSLEGCIGCHMPHGSVNPQLERMPMPALCVKCHEPTSHQFLQLGTRCTLCHTDIHGSNHNRELFF